MRSASAKSAILCLATARGADGPESHHVHKPRDAAAQRLRQSVPPLSLEAAALAATFSFSRLCCSSLCLCSFACFFTLNRGRDERERDERERRRGSSLTRMGPLCGSLHAISFSLGFKTVTLSRIFSDKPSPTGISL